MKTLQYIWQRFAQVLVLSACVLSILLAGDAFAQTQPQQRVIPGSDPDLKLQIQSETARNKLLLSSLFGRLKQSESVDSARVLEGAIWKVWLKSGSPTIDLLMQQVLRSMARGEYTLTLKLLDRIVELAPEFSEGWNKRATVLYLVGNFEASLDDIERVLELEPRHFGALSGMGLVLQRLGDKKGALNAFRQALSVHPFLPTAKLAVKKLQKEIEGQGI
jgi:tetratricopeptide (TPR) repeat protein